VVYVVLASKVDWHCDFLCGVSCVCSCQWSWGVIEYSLRRWCERCCSDFFVLLFLL